MSAWVLVPKMLTQAMAQAIRDAADNRRFESWPANCWEGAIAVAPKPPSAPSEVQKFSAALTLCPSGYVVRAEDFDALKAENQRLHEQIENLELELRVLGEYM